MMVPWMPVEIAYIVETFFTSGSSIITAQRRFRHFQKCEAPSRKVILCAVSNFHETGNANKKPSPGRPRTSHSAVNIEHVANAIVQSPRKSTHRLAQQVNITHTSVRRILKNDLKLYPYEVQLVHQFLPADRVHRVTFSEWYVSKCREENDFVQHLITSDAAHLHLSGYVNKQNFRFGGKENPQLLHETPLHSVVGIAFVL
jgi:hypothetical protein